MTLSFVAVEFAGRGTVISLRGPFDRGSGALFRGPPAGPRGALICDCPPRGALICDPPRSTPAPEGRGTDCGRICGAFARAFMSGRALLTGPRAVPIAPLLSPTGPRDDPIRAEARAAACVDEMRTAGEDAFVIFPIDAEIGVHFTNPH